MTNVEKRNVGIIVSVVIVASIGFSFFIRYRNTAKMQNPASSVVTPTPKPVPTTTPKPIADATGSIIVTNVIPGQLVPSGSIIKGTAVAFESQFAWRLLDGNGVVIAQGSVHANQPDAGIPGPFEFIVEYPSTTSVAGTLVVFEPSPKDGSDTHVVQISVMLGQP